MDNWNALTSNATSSPAIGGRDTPTGVIKEKLVSKNYCSYFLATYNFRT